MQALMDQVSIHAPVMGATLVYGVNMASEYVSIHAPVMGATGYLTQSLTTLMFQSTRP